MSMNLNRAILLGNLTGNAEIKSSGDRSFATGTIAVNRGKEDVDYVDFTAPEALAEYLVKGKTISLVGGVTTEAFGRKDGSPGASIKVLRPDVNLGDFMETTARGRLVGDAEVRDGNNGQFASFTVAVNTGSGDNKRTTYVDVTANVGTVVPEGLIEALKKGTEIAVTGNVSARAYMPKEGDEPRGSLRLGARIVQVGRAAQAEGQDSGSAAPDFS